MKPDLTKLDNESIIALLFECFRKIDIQDIERYLNHRYERYDENRKQRIGLVINAATKISTEDIISYMDERLKNVLDKKEILNDIGWEFKSVYAVAQKLEDGFKLYREEFNKRYPIVIMHDDDDLIDSTETARMLYISTKTLASYKKSGRIVPVKTEGKTDYYRVGDIMKFSVEI